MTDMNATTDTPAPDDADPKPEPIHVAVCTTVRSRQAVTAPLCGQSGETAAKLEDATYPACIEILAAARPRPADIIDYENPDGVDIRIADEHDADHEALRRRVSVPTTKYLTVPEDAITFTPMLANVVYGDGRELFAFTTLNDRPAFWAVRGDSSWRTKLETRPGTDITEFVEIITENLRREFGDAEPEGKDDEPLDANDQPEYPEIDLRGGYSWWRLRRYTTPAARHPDAPPPAP